MQSPQSRIICDDANQEPAIAFQRCCIATQRITNIDGVVGIVIEIPMTLPEDPEFVAMKMHWVVSGFGQKAVRNMEDQ
jgi:hypothetical protein